jgi:hypothetical protein
MHVLYLPRYLVLVLPEHTQAVVHSRPLPVKYVHVAQALRQAHLQWMGMHIAYTSTQIRHSTK